MKPTFQFLLDCAEWTATKLRWSWAVFQIMGIKERLNLRWRK